MGQKADDEAGQSCFLHGCGDETYPPLVALLQYITKVNWDSISA